MLLVGSVRNFMLSGDQLGYLAIKASENGITTFSMWIMLFAFSLRFIFKDAGFEHLKIMASLIFVAYVSAVSIEVYKLDRVHQLDNQIISIKSSNLSSIDKDKYLAEADKNIETINQIQINGVIFLLAKFAIVGVFLIMLRDTLGSWLESKFPKRKDK